MNEATFDLYSQHISSFHPTGSGSMEKQKTYFEEITFIDFDALENALGPSSESNTLSYETIAQNHSLLCTEERHADAVAKAVCDFFAITFRNGFFICPSEKQIPCPAGCGSEFTTRPGFKYHLAKYKHRFGSLPDDLDFDGTFRFPIYFEKEDIEEYWTITFAHKSNAASSQSSPKKRRKSTVKAEDFPGESAEQRFFSKTISFSTLKSIISPCVSFSPLEHVNFPLQEKTQLMYKNKILHISSNLEPSSFNSDIFFYFGPSFLVSKSLWISDDLLLIVVVPRGISYLAIPTSSSHIFITNARSGKITKGIEFSSVILDCCLVDNVENEIIVCILAAGSVQLIVHPLEDSSRFVSNLQSFSLSEIGCTFISVTYDVNSGLLACGGMDGSVAVFDLNLLETSRDPILLLTNHHFSPVVSLSLHCNLLSSISHDGILRITDLSLPACYFATTSILPGILTYFSIDNYCLFSDYSYGLRCIDLNADFSSDSGKSKILNLEPQYANTGSTTVASSVRNTFCNGVYLGTSFGEVYFVRNPSGRYKKVEKLFEWENNTDGSLIYCNCTENASGKKDGRTFNSPFITNIATKKLTSCSLSNGILHLFETH